MRRVEPKVFLVGESKINHDAVRDYLRHVGPEATTWHRANEDGTRSHSETLVEFMGRLCYRSWAPGLNPNVTKVRTDHAEYVANILKSGHGSVIEHPVSHWVFADVSRVFTHEFVRHRAGTAFSQESLRYVRLTDLGLWLPPEIEAEPEVARLFEKTFRDLESLQVHLARALGIETPCPECAGRTYPSVAWPAGGGCPKCDGSGYLPNEKMKFDEKKKLTSAMRRVAPIGLATTIGATLNMRALRHVLTMRSEGAAEAEMRLIFGKVGEIAKERWPSLFQDFSRQEDGSWKPEHRKV